MHQPLLAGLLGNIGFKSDEDGEYLGARGIRFAHLSRARPAQEAGPLDRRGRAGRDDAALRARHRAIEPRWLELAGHLIKTALLDPHWEKKAARGDGARARDALRPRRSTRAGACTSARSTRPRRARSSSARRWSRANGRRGAVLRANQQADHARSRSSSTSRAGRTCSSTSRLIFAFYDHRCRRTCTAAPFRRGGRKPSARIPSCCSDARSS